MHGGSRTGGFNSAIPYQVAQEEAASAEKKLQAAQASKLSCWEQMDKVSI